MQPTRKAIYLFVRSYMLCSDGRPPSVSEIAAGARRGRPMSKSVVDYHLDALAAGGLILRVPLADGRRTIQLPGAHYIPPPLPVFLE